MVLVAHLVLLLVRHAYLLLNAQNVIRMAKHIFKIINVTLVILHVRLVMIVDALNVQMHTIKMDKIV